ncbi:hypothetical protein PRZ48_005503 [Zasmidium cellare]|uniref:FAD-binding domain-containing protein n=1 Tax=Zasmidium cellare TaxID=395010 RepID=A0ABR0ESK7_ZASCE|nr:hypothetical protein PRZ48_005503 [Zasmidium cellare]
MAYSSPSSIVCIVGAGISGLTAAAYLLQDNVRVVLVERRSEDSDKSVGGGLDLTANATACLDAIGLKSAFAQIAELKQRVDVRRGTDGTTLLSLPRPSAMVHRADLMVMLKEHVRKLGADFIWDDSISSIAEGSDMVKVMLQSGKVIEANVVIGADGHSSTNNVYQSSKNAMNLWLGPSRSIVDWTMTKRNNYHLQINDHVFGEGEGYGLEGSFDGTHHASQFSDLPALQARFADFSETFSLILAEAKSCTLWRTAELSELPSWSSAGGRVVLIGDAAHNFPPYAGQGAAMAIEDAAVLGTLVRRTVKSGTTMRAAAKTYERLRRPRIDACRNIVRANMHTLSLEKLEDQFPPLQMMPSGGAATPRADEPATMDRLLALLDHNPVQEASDSELLESLLSPAEVPRVKRPHIKKLEFGPTMEKQ